jgi:hypothetical protein
MNHAPTLDRTGFQLGGPCRNSYAPDPFNALSSETTTDFFLLRASLRSEQKDKHAFACIKALDPTFSKKTGAAPGHQVNCDINLFLNYQMLYD